MKFKHGDRVTCKIRGKMTKREPFVKDVEKIFLDMFGEWGVSDGLECPISGIYDDQQEEFFFRLNAAHEARVKEEVRKALDKFKSMLRILCVKCGMPEHIHCEMDEPGVDHSSSCGKFHHEFKPEDKNDEII